MNGKVKIVEIFPHRGYTFHKNWGFPILKTALEGLLSVGTVFAYTIVEHNNYQTNQKIKLCQNLNF
jgi:hypothetical protein